MDDDDVDDLDGDDDDDYNEDYDDDDDDDDGDDDDHSSYRCPPIQPCCLFLLYIWESANSTNTTWSYQQLLC